MKLLYVVGIGGGNRFTMTGQAIDAINDSEVVCGYTRYIDMVKNDFENKVFFANGMSKEYERCRYALDAASKGYTTSIVCSGDCGIYAMASLILQMSKDFPYVKIELVPGVTAALLAASVIGSPLTVDFAVISLSNILMPQSIIDKKLAMASIADFTIVLYNPRSNNRPNTLKNACDIVLKYREPTTPAAFVRQAGKADMTYKIFTLEDLRDAPLDMLCTVFIASSRGKVIHVNNKEYLVEDRGYKI